MILIPGRPQFLRRASELYTLRQHRARSITVTDAELVEVRYAPPLPRRRHRRRTSHSPEEHALSSLPATRPASPSPAALSSSADVRGRSPPAPLLQLPRLPDPKHHHHPSLHIWARAISPPFVSDAQLVEIRASQRTFEGAYIRTALGLFSFALIVLKIFTAEFYSVGALFAAYGASVLLIALYRRHQGNRQYFEIVGEDGLQRKRFRTSGNVVLTLTALSVCAYGALLALVVRLL